MIAVVAFDQISPFHLAVPCVVFGESHPGAPPVDLRVCAAESGPLRTSAGFSVAVEHGLDAVNDADTVIVPSWRDPEERPSEQLLTALQKAHRRGANIVGLCLGAYVLAEAGLLEGRRATTHWSFAQDFASRYPGVTVDADVLYIDEGSLLTSAGTAAGIDCCLHLLRREHGALVANRVARRLVVSPLRQGGQAQFIERPVPATSRDSHLAMLIDDVRATLNDAHTLDSMATSAAMSRRTFSRHFRQLTGTTVGGWLLSERLARCQQLLEATSHPIEHIADMAGFGSAEALRHHFKTAFGVPPKTWRQSFRSE